MFDFNNAEQVASKLKELQERNIPCMTLDKLLSMNGYGFLKSYKETATEEEIKECEEHLNKYCEAGYNDGKDIFSDEKCYFRWGMAHGEMVTNDNGLARTYYHYLNLGGKRHRIDMLLQYHPSCYEIEGQNNDDSV